MHKKDPYKKTNNCIIIQFSNMSSRTVSASPAAAYKSDNLSKKISPIVNKSASSPDDGLSISKAFTLSHVLKFTNILTRSIYPL